MVNLDSSRLERLLNAFSGKRIAVVGDLMLDRYFWGSVRRISPEAPVPIVEVEEESTRLGGAANVANNLASLGAVPLLVGVSGADANGQLLRTAIAQLGFSLDGIVEDASRPTTVKSRVIAHHQHVVRIDQEVKDDVNESVQGRIMDYLERELPTIDGVILQDYNKGVLTGSLIRRVIELTHSSKKILTVDPKFNNFFSFKGSTVFKPNRKETEEALGVRIRSHSDVVTAGKSLLGRLEAENILMTLGEEGMALFESAGDVSFVPTKARHVADVSGAGDTVIATLTLSLASGASVKEAAALANYAGGTVCGEVGIVPISTEALRTAVVDHEHPDRVS